jgi:hypothetical protein
MRSGLTQTTENRPSTLCFYTDSNTSAWPCAYLPALDHHQSDQVSTAHQHERVIPAAEATRHQVPNPRAGITLATHLAGMDG